MITLPWNLLGVPSTLASNLTINIDFNFTQLGEYNNYHKDYKCVTSYKSMFELRHVASNENYFLFHEGFLDTWKYIKVITNDIFL